MTEFVVVLVLPLSDCIHKFVVDVLAIDNQIVVHMVDEVPWICEGLAHRFKLIKVGSNSCLALLELSSDISNDCTKVLHSVENTVKGSVSKLINDTANSLPDMLGISEAFNSVGDFSLNSASEQTFEDFSHSKEREVHV